MARAATVVGADEGTACWGATQVDPPSRRLMTIRSSSVSPLAVSATSSRPHWLQNCWPDRTTAPHPAHALDSVSIVGDFAAKVNHSLSHRPD